MITTLDDLKARFQNTDKPDQADFIDLIDTMGAWTKAAGIPVNHLAPGTNGQILQTVAGAPAWAGQFAGLGVGSLFQSVKTTGSVASPSATWADPSSSGAWITQSAHGFVVGNVLSCNFDGTNTTFGLAMSNSSITSGVAGVVAAVALDGNSFFLASGGQVSTSDNTFPNNALVTTDTQDVTLSRAFAPGQTYYLSDTVAGCLTPTPPIDSASFVVPVLLAIGPNAAVLTLQAPSAVPNRLNIVLPSTILGPWNPVFNSTVMALARTTARGHASASGYNSSTFVGGYYSVVAGASHIRVAKLGSLNGGVDSSFTGGLNTGSVRSLLMVNDDDLFVAGQFTKWTGTKANVAIPDPISIAKVNTSGGSDVNGLLDNTFDCRVDYPGAPAGVYYITSTAYSSGYLYMGGYFNRVTSGSTISTGRYHIAKVDASTGALQAGFSNYSGSPFTYSNTAVPVNKVLAIPSNLSSATLPIYSGGTTRFTNQAVTVSTAGPRIFTLANHGLQEGSRVQLTVTSGASGFTSGTTWLYVLSTNLTSSTFELSTTRGGSAVIFSGPTSGSGCTITTGMAATFAGKILIAGGFTNYRNASSPTPYLVMVDPSDGTVVSAFTSPNTVLNGPVWSVCFNQENEDIIAVGDFTAITTAASGTVPCNHIAVFDNTGAFRSTGASSYYNLSAAFNGRAKEIVQMTEMSNPNYGAFMVGGSFTTVYPAQTQNTATNTLNSTVGRLVRLKSDYSYDSSFGVVLNSDVNTIMELPDTSSNYSTVVGGAFTLANGVSRLYSAKFDSTGALA